MHPGKIAKLERLKVNRFLSIAVFLCLIALGAFNRSFAQSASASQVLKFEVKPIIRLVVCNDPGPMIISPDQSGASVAETRGCRARYSLVTNAEAMRISVSIDKAMPAGTSLLITLESTSGKSKGEVDISGATMPMEVVTDIQRGSDRDQSIYYRFQAGPEIGKLKAEERTVTLTLTN